MLLYLVLSCFGMGSAVRSGIQAASQSAAVKEFPGWWPLEGSIDDSHGLSGGTCTFEKGAARQLFGAEGRCDLLYLSSSQLIYLHITSPEEDPRDYVFRTDRQKTELRVHEQWGPELGLHDGSTSRLIHKLYFRAPGDNATSEAAITMVFNDVVAKSKPPSEVAARTVKIDYDATCHAEIDWSTYANARRHRNIGLHWNLMAHHLTVVVEQRPEVVKRPFWNVVKNAVNSSRYQEPEQVTVSMAPPSCYVDPTASLDCALYQSHLTELQSLLQCLNLPLDTKEAQKLAADFLRQTLFAVREPVSVREVVVDATRALWRAHAMRFGGSNFHLPRDR